MDCIEEYCKPEILDADNLWLCERCGNKVKAIKRLQIWKNQIILVIQIKRFNLDKMKKDNRLISFPLVGF